MSSSQLSKSLFAAAREDAPSIEVQEQVWSRVAAVVAPPAVAAGAASTLAAPATGKAVTIFGVTFAAGVAVLGLVVASSFGDEEPVRASGPRSLPAVVASGPTAGARLAETSPRGRAASIRPADVVGTPLATAAQAVTPGAHDEASALAEEARLVTEARTALVGGDPERAFALAQRTHGLPMRALEPEELGLEARALRALGRTDEALATELLLRRRFPDHALSR